MQSTMEQQDKKKNTQSKNNRRVAVLQWAMSILKEDSHNKAPVRCDCVVTTALSLIH